MTNPTASQSVDRALEILVLVGESGESGPTELAERLGVHKSTASRLLRALERRGLVEQDGERGRYRLGHTMVRLAAGMIGRLDVTQHSQGPCAALLAEFGETTSVVVADGDHEVVVLNLPGHATVSAGNWVGKRMPLYATSTGKVLLSELGEQELARRLPAVPDPLTAHTVVDPGVFREQLAEARRRRYATSFGELEDGLNAVSAPIRDAGGRVVAAVSVAGPAFRMAESRLAEIAPRVIRAGEEISRGLGYVPGAFTDRPA